MHENGTYSPKMGRPVNDVNYIRESLSTPKTMRTEIGPEPTPDYPTSTDLLDDLHKSIEMLEMETSALFAQIDRALAEVTETQCEPRPGPRISNSNLTYRIAYAADLIDELANRVNLIRRRVTI